MKNLFKKFINKKKVITTSVLGTLLTLNCNTVFADSIQDSKLATGFTRLMEDMTTVIMQAIITVGIVTILVAFFMKGKVQINPDEMDQRKWDKVWHTALVCIIASVVVKGLVTIVISYFA